MLEKGRERERENYCKVTGLIHLTHHAPPPMHARSTLIDVVSIQLLMRFPLKIV